MRRLLGILLVMVLVISLGACGGKTEEKKAADKSEIVVAGVVFQEDQFMKLLSQGYQDAAKDAGVKCLTGNTGNDQAKETELVNTYVAQKVAGIAIAPLNQETSVQVLKKADEQGVKIALTNIDLKDVPFIVGGYTSDQANLGAASGKIAATYIKEKLGGKAKIAIIEFKSLLPDQSNGRVNGFLDEVKKVNPNVEVVADQDAWIQDKAIAVAGDVLTANKDIDVIFAANDGGTIGSTMAVKNAGLAGKVAVFGIDTGEQQIAMLKDPDNILQAITGQDPYNMGYKAMETLIKGIKGEDISASKGKTEIVDGVLLSRDDPDGIAKFEADLKARMGN